MGDALKGGSYLSRRYAELGRADPLTRGAQEVRDPCCCSHRGGEMHGCQEAQRAAAGLWGMGPRREACESCCREKPRSVLYDASYLANAVIVSLKWLRHLWARRFCLASMRTCRSPRWCARAAWDHWLRCRLPRVLCLYAVWDSKFACCVAESM